MPKAGKQGWIYKVPPGRWEERRGRGGGVEGWGAQTGEFINVAPRCQLGAGGVGGAQPGLQCRLCSTGPPSGQHQTGAVLRRCPRPLIIFTPSPGLATLPLTGPGRG